ncbi:aminopeptidase P family N-terminal domain-containing protein [Paraburkholderia sp. ZP32-5]|uniref:aminopeptidase P family N-terminal domain-containing protein n=1 Tax=Paraburkholderia sp. ZP32-5 TaxID=2883245 RepID=UPI001F33C04C|nr:aminopeptidase P family N-terminal domain-containing protein [Paraburkholderia sp. ZP32-5]
MRRGLVSWSREELPQAALDARVERLQQAMRAQGLAAVLAYGSFAQPAVVQWLSNFLPYWGDAMLAVFPEGRPVLLTALTRRVHPWIQAVSHTGEVVTAPRLGVSVAALLDARVAPGERIGVIGRGRLPWRVAMPLADSAHGPALVDASELFSGVRQPADDAELGLAARAAAIAGSALRAIPSHAASTSAVTAAVEAAARLAGAEEVLQRVAPDLAVQAVPRRIEGSEWLGQRYAVDLSLAYKGVWVRAARCVSREPSPVSWQRARHWFEATAAGLQAASATPVLDNAPGDVRGWTLEACVGAHALECVASLPTGCLHPLPAGALAMFSVELRLDDGPWRASVPLVFGQPGTPARLLTL